MRQNQPADVFALQATQKRKFTIPNFAQRQREGSDLPTGHSGKPLGLQLNIRHINIMLVLMLLFGLLVVGRVFYLQVLKGGVYQALAEDNSQKTERSVAPRGLIYDRQLRPLVKNEVSFKLKLISADLPTSVQDQQRLTQDLTGLLAQDSHFQGTDLAAVLSAAWIQSQEEPVVTVAQELDFPTVLSLKLRQNLPGVLIEQNLNRHYLLGEPFAHLLGYLGRIQPGEWPKFREQDYYYSDLVGRSGLEARYESLLRGQDEIVKVEINASGEEQRLVAKDKLVPGHNLVLAIDSQLQAKLYTVLARQAAQSGVDRGAAVALNPLTGEILALVNVPAYDNNLFNGDKSEDIQSLLVDPNQPLFNRAISGTYPPGSTFKPVVGAAALTEGLITPVTLINSQGGLRINDWFFPDWQAGGHGLTNLTKAIAESVNTYFYYLAGGYEDFTGLGVDLINKYARLFGLGRRLGIDLPGEADGFLPSRAWKEKNKQEAWYVGDTYHLGIGQGDILVTPLQLATLTATFANGGTLYQPYLVKSVSLEDGTIVQNIMPTVLNQQVLPAEHIEQLRLAYRQAVLSGSAISLQGLPVTTAGKTGTAQVSGDLKAHGWFTGWAPYENPEIVLTVLVENATGGNTSALPVFRDIMNWYFSSR